MIMFRKGARVFKKERTLSYRAEFFNSISLKFLRKYDTVFQISVSETYSRKMPLSKQSTRFPRTETNLLPINNKTNYYVLGIFLFTTDVRNGLHAFQWNT